MEENRIAALANLALYNADFVKQHRESPAHLNHLELRRLYAQLVVRVMDFSKQYTETPRVLDIGAGGGTNAILFLEMGAKVTAVDISSSQLELLRERCLRYGDKLDIHCSEVDSFLESTPDQYDIIVASSFLHHIPDYIGLLGKALPRLSPYGQFFSFQDPLRYDSLGRFTFFFSRLSHFAWRLSKGDVTGGIRRLLRRSRGVYLQDSVHDNAEYHVVRDGVDQEAILKFFREAGFDCEIIRYFSTHIRLLQRTGDSLRLTNEFAVIARRNPALPRPI